MVGNKRSNRKQTLLSGNHQKCWLWGRHAVLETLLAGKWLPLEVYVDTQQCDSHVLQQVEDAANRWNCPLRYADQGQISRLCGVSEHQGLLAKMPPFPYTREAELWPLCTVNKLVPGSRPPFLLLLDGIQDPFNFGAILRTAEVLGVHGVFVPAAGQAEVSLHVARSSAGAVNHLPICRVDALPLVSLKLKELGLKVIGASEKGSIAPAQAPLAGPIALVIGNEGTGISPSLLECCDFTVRIPQSGQIGSLNAAVAAGILCYEVTRQRT